MKKRRAIKGNRRRGASSKGGQGSRQLGWWRWVVRGGFYIVIVFSAGVALQHAQRFFSIDLQQVALPSDLTHVDRQDMIEAIEPWLADSYYSIDLRQIKRALEQHPWIYRANVMRAWPRGLHIDIEQEKAIARWGEGAYINAEGDIFAQGSDATLDNLPV
ncbi:MAG: cell division protein FtsQ/DivIB, partial [Pseudomonadales bacterium]